MKISLNAAFVAFFAGLAACAPGMPDDAGTWRHKGDLAETEYVVGDASPEQAYFSVTVKHKYLSTVKRHNGEVEEALDAFHLRTLEPVPMLQRAIDGEFPINDRWKDLDHDTVSLNWMRIWYPRTSDEGRFYTRGFVRFGDEKFGLVHEGVPVPSRPSDHWEHAFLKSGVPEDEFFVICRPTTPGFSVGPIDTCSMTFVVASGEIDQRPITLRASVEFHVERLPEWKHIESVVRETVIYDVQFHAGRSG